MSVVSYQLKSVSPARQEKYKSHYERLVQRGKTRASTRKEANLVLDGYCEEHHIIPTCVGGLDIPENRVFLSAREHFIAHQLLIFIYPTSIKLAMAAEFMMHDSQGEKTGGRKFEWIKKRNSLARIGRNKENDEGIERGAAKKRGRTKHTHLHIAAQALKITGRTKETHSGVELGASKKRGKTKVNCESRRHQSQTRTGWTKDNHTGTAAQSEKMTGRTKENNSGMAQMAVTLTGRTKDTHAGIAAQSKKITGRTKETHSSVALMAEKLTGRTKENNIGVAKASEKKFKIPKEIREIFFRRFLEGENIVNLYDELETYELPGVSLPYLRGLFRRLKKELEVKSG